MTSEFNRWSGKTIWHLFDAMSSFVHYSKATSQLKLELQSGNFKLCASFHSHLWSQAGATVRKRPIWVKIGNFLSRVTLKFDRWPWKTIGHLFYATSSFMYHFIAIGQFKLELQSGNTQFWSKSTIFLSRATLKFDRWPWKTIGHLFYATSSSVHHIIAICEFKLELQSGNAQFVPRDLEIRRMTLKNNRTHLLCFYKLCASFHSHLWIQTETGVPVRKRPIWVKIGDFFVPCDLAIWWMTLKNHRTPLLSNIKFCASFHHHVWIQTGVTARNRLSWVLTYVTLTFDLWPWPLHGHHFSQWWQLLEISCWYGDRNIVKRVSQTDGRTDGRSELFLKLLGRS